MKYTTLKEIKKHNPCSDGWSKLLFNLGKTKADSEQLSLLRILESNGIEDAIWALRAVKDIDKDARLFAVWCAREVVHLVNDDDEKNKYNEVLSVVERYANGLATADELASASAWESASASAWASAWASASTSASAWASAWESASASAWASASTSASARERQKAKFIEMFCESEQPNKEKP